MNQNPALKITFWYLVVGFSWIYFGGELLSDLLNISTENNPFFEIAKGFGYVSITGLLLYLMVNTNYNKRIRREIALHSNHMAALKETNRKFEMATRATNEVIWEWDISRKIIWFSKNFEKFYWKQLPEDGWLNEDVWYQLIHPEDRAHVEKTLRETIDGNQPYWIAEYRIKLQDGEILHILDKGVIERKADKKMHKMIGSMQDITALRKLNIEKEETEARFRMIVNNSLEGIWMIDEHNITSFINHSMAAMLGFSPQEMMGESYFKFMEIDAIDQATALLEERKLGKHGQHEFCFKHKNGSLVETIVVSTPVFEHDVYKGSIKLITEITQIKEKERLVKRSEEQYKLLFASNPLPMWVYNPEDFRFLAVNEAACRHYGFTQEEFLQLKVTEIRPPEEIQRFTEFDFANHYDVLRHAGIWKHKKKDGTLIDVEIRAHDITYEDKMARLILINDVTEKLKAEEKLRKSHDELKILASHLQEVRDDERKQIAREIHDELGQKLTAVKLDLAWLAKRLKDENPALLSKVVQTTSLLDESNVSIRRILNELRTDFITRFGLEDGLRWLMNEFSRHSGVPVELHMNQPYAEYPEHIATSLYRILQESLTNITKHAEANQVWADIEFADEHITARITDDGKGFDDTTVNGKSFGLLGMKERMAQINGTFTVKSSPGKGTTISIHIPINKSKNNIE